MTIDTIGLLIIVLSILRRICHPSRSGKIRK
jgi:hypothetical protein